VQAQLEGQVKLLDKWRKPAGGYRAGVACDDYHPQVLRIELQVISAYLGAGRRDQIGERPSTKCKQALVWSKGGCA
jgi:hypothetical protein